MFNVFWSFCSFLCFQMIFPFFWKWIFIFIQLFRQIHVYFIQKEFLVTCRINIYFNLMLSGSPFDAWNFLENKNSGKLSCQEFLCLSFNPTLHPFAGLSLSFYFFKLIFLWKCLKSIKHTVTVILTSQSTIATPVSHDITLFVMLNKLQNNAFMKNQDIASNPTELYIMVSEVEIYMYEY